MDGVVTVPVVPARNLVVEPGEERARLWRDEGQRDVEAVVAADLQCPAASSSSRLGSCCWLSASTSLLDRLDDVERVYSRLPKLIEAARSIADLDGQALYVFLVPTAVPQSNEDGPGGDFGH